MSKSTNNLSNVRWNLDRNNRVKQKYNDFLHSNAKILKIWGEYVYNRSQEVYVESDTKKSTVTYELQYGFDPDAAYERHPYAALVFFLEFVNQADFDEESGLVWDELTMMEFKSRPTWTVIRQAIKPGMPRETYDQYLKELLDEMYASNCAVPEESGLPTPNIDWNKTYSDAYKKKNPLWNRYSKVYKDCSPTYPETNLTQHPFGTLMTYVASCQDSLMWENNIDAHKPNDPKGPWWWTTKTLKPYRKYLYKNSLELIRNVNLSERDARALRASLQKQNTTKQNVPPSGIEPGQ